MSRTLVRLLSWTLTLGVVSSMPLFAQDHTTIKTFPNGAFALGWTSIVSTPGGILYYNTATGAGAIGRFDGAGNHTTLKVFPPRAFATGWSRIVSTPSGILFYNDQTGAGAVGRIQ